ncbi:AfsR/SARP family transcriptional regulator [Micromonospora haikouensis]|uniref:AfsR/SARP family transcriptional regulator n=1 Tax=Micromonospora haikouensis TaxID=686309 RepID=UPI0037A95826
MLPNPPAAVTVRFLGDFAVTVDGVPVERWRAGKARNLFQFLVLNRGHVVPRERLYEVLWPDSDTDRSTSLKVAAHALRQILGSCPGGTGVEIVYQDVGYLLRCAEICVDAEEFEAAVDAAREAERTGDTGAALAAHHRAISLYQGDFLNGETADWVDEQRQWTRAMVLRSLHHLRADAMLRDDPRAVVTWCRRILSVDPYQEEAYQNLLVVHGMLGELGQVRSWYDLCVQRLRDGLDVGPTGRTRQIRDLALTGRLRGRRASAPRPASPRRPAARGLQPLSLTA